ncbi:MAG: AmmeMemoRadiSam system protein B [Candidatus Nanoarchaeia archaeon]|nr:AmmeMemoRadiSam system protein B [Candidatus Nanoarchaeia archaeon]MDD5239505.1 AmmeMemoRadiSam system protein B [Candidatus Nanoarchaeia archaeon]
MIREPAFAGQFYEANPQKLRAQIEICFKGKLGPKSMPGRQASPIIAAVIPHAGYVYSGQCAAHAYKAIAESGKPDTIVLLCPSHTGMGPSVSVYPDGKWKTPLGEVPVDSEFVNKMLAYSKKASPDEIAHRSEHAIEVHLPFLQYLFKDFKIVPICMKGIKVLEEANDIVSGILNAAYELKRKVLVIASSDFTHYGESFMYTPYKANQIKKVEALDKKAIGFIEKFREIDLLKHVVQNNATICGYAPITAAIIYARSMKSKSVRLLKYYTSAEITGDSKNFVAYASMVFDKNEGKAKKGK